MARRAAIWLQIAISFALLVSTGSTGAQLHQHPHAIHRTHAQTGAAGLDAGSRPRDARRGGRPHEGSARSGARGLCHSRAVESFRGRHRGQGASAQSSRTARSRRDQVQRRESGFPRRDRHSHRSRPRLYSDRRSKRPPRRAHQPGHGAEVLAGPGSHRPDRQARRLLAGRQTKRAWWALPKTLPSTRSAKFQSRISTCHFIFPTWAKSPLRSRPASTR